MSCSPSTATITTPSSVRSSSIRCVSTPRKDIRARPFSVYRKRHHGHLGSKLELEPLPPPREPAWNRAYPLAPLWQTLRRPSRIAKKALDDENVSPVAVEAPVPSVNPDVQPSAAVDELDAVAVGREDLSDQLVEAAALRGFGEVLEQAAADAFPASAALDVQHGLGDL